MIRSMTAFARLEHSESWGSITWEIRSVNHRYLEPHFKLPEQLRSLEPKLREQIRQSLGRGKVECSLRYQLHAQQESKLQLNLDLARQLLDAASSIEQLMPHPAQFSALNVLQWPGVINESPLDADALHGTSLAAFAQTLEQLRSFREREGAELQKLIGQRLTSISRITAEVREKLPAILAGQHQKLSDRLAEAKLEVDPARLEQELVLLAQKSDVAEELDRLDTHVIEVTRTLKKGGACGRRLDFLMQELNREANTLSSKSIVSETTQSAVELKVMIEQMREQVQNIE